MCGQTVFFFNPVIQWSSGPFQKTTIQVLILASWDLKDSRCFFIAHLTPPKFNSEFTPEKLPFHPIGKASVPTTIFQGRAVKLPGV